MKRVTVSEVSDRRDVGAIGLYRKNGTRFDGLAVEVDRTGTAHTALTADVRAGVAELVAKRVHQ